MSPMIPRSPCFDRKTKTDCPKRSLTCRSECEEFQKYERDRMIFYQQRKLDGELKTKRPLTNREMRTFYRIRNGR